MIQNVVVLGAGSAGLIAAISLKCKLPMLNVRIVRSPDIGVIGVGEGTTPTLPNHLFQYLGINRKFFYANAQPTWKIGIRLVWGPRPHFYYPLLREVELQRADLPMTNGYYCQEDCSIIGQLTALMENGKVFMRNTDGSPNMHAGIGFHIENKKLVDTLETIARSLNIEFIDARVAGATRGKMGIDSITLDDGRQIAADFFIDSSGFRSELMGKALEEPYIPFDKTLFCDRAVVGGWERTTEPILPFTTSETMDAGWCWQIEHEHYVNRGYVFCSSFISDDDARAEFRRKNPKLPDNLRVVKFRSGRYRRAWVDNVVAVGNACGFVEPLEATALMVVCAQCQSLCNFLAISRLSPTPTLQSLYNTAFAIAWDEIRDFLGLHYKLNTRLDNPFWRHCREDTDLSGIQDVMDFYQENGPSPLCQHLLKFTQSPFGADGFLSMFVGNQAPYRNSYQPSPQEQSIWHNHRSTLRAQASTALTVKEALGYIRHPAWQWYGDTPAPLPGASA